MSRPSGFIDLTNAFSASAAPASTTPKQTMLQSLLGGVRVAPAAALSQHAVQLNQANAAAGIQPGRQAVGAVQNQVRLDKAAISNVIRQAQREVTAMTKSLGESPAIFATQQLAAGGEVGLVASAAAGVALHGAGSIVTMGQDASAVLSDLKSSGDKKEIQYKVQEALAKASSRPVDSRLSGQFSFAQPEAAYGETNFDWKSFSDEGHDIAALMSMNPDEPNDKIVPEWRAADKIDASAKATMGQLDVAEDQTIDDGRDNTQEQIASNEWDPDDQLLLGVFSAGPMLEGMSGAKVPNADLEEARLLYQRFAREFAQTMPGAVVTAAPSMRT